MIGIKNVIAIICGGGPAPGINSVISAVTIEADRHGWDVLGIYDGFSRLARGEKKYVRLDMERVNRIHLTGGCILQMSRYNPTKKESDLRTVVDTLTELGVTPCAKDHRQRPAAARGHPDVPFRDGARFRHGGD